MRGFFLSFTFRTAAVYFAGMNEQIISGSETIRRARNLKLVPDAYFTLLFLTCDMRTGRCGELRKYEHCRVRPTLKSDTFRMDGDLYFTFEDLDTGEPKMCFKRLIRFISFPSDYKLLKIDWYNGESDD